MWPNSYFPLRYWPPRYWPKTGSGRLPSIEITSSVQRSTVVDGTTQRNVGAAANAQRSVVLEGDARSDS